VGGQRHALAALPPVKTRYPLCRRIGGPQGLPTGIRSQDRPACGESLHRLQMCACKIWTVGCIYSYLNPPYMLAAWKGLRGHWPCQTGFAQTKMGRQYKISVNWISKIGQLVSKIEQNGKTSVRRLKLLIKEVKRLMKKILETESGSSKLQSVENCPSKRV